MIDVAVPDFRADTGKRPGLAMPASGIGLMAISPVVDFGLGLIGLVDHALDAARWEVIGAVAGASCFMIGLNLLALGLIRRSRRGLLAPPALPPAD
ncbi:MAG: hypothetical protein LBS27_06615 [Bifidobacteriaceae bacterium]|jgi:hypothetical protein|nr:hypothetical protein [Bifidobacteriaceae bacterium]